MPIGSVFAENILLFTPLLQWCLRIGLVMTKVHRIVEYEARACFDAAGKRKAAARRAVDVNPEVYNLRHGEADRKILLWETVTNKEKFTKVKYLSDVEQSRELDRLVSRALLLCLNPLDDEYYVVETRAGTIRIDLPSQIASFAIFYRCFI